jgi:hypothetical protein
MTAVALNGHVIEIVVARRHHPKIPEALIANGYSVRDAAV